MITYKMISLITLLTSKLHFGIFSHVLMFGAWTGTDQFYDHWQDVLAVMTMVCLVMSRYFTHERILTHFLVRNACKM